MQAEVRCVKARFASRKEAKRVSKDMTRKMGFKYRPYQCQWCDQYHITHNARWPENRSEEEMSDE